jgi:hypothetical protein
MSSFYSNLAQEDTKNTKKKIKKKKKQTNKQTNESEKCYSA